MVSFAPLMLERSRSCLATDSGTRLPRQAAVFGAAKEPILVVDGFALRQVQAAMAAMDHLLGRRRRRPPGAAFAPKALGQQPHGHNDKDQ